MGTGFVISMKFVLYGSPKDVYEALTNSTAIEQWSNAKGLFEAKPNGTFNWFDGWATGTVVAVEKNKSLEFTWKASDWSKKTKESLVHIQLNEHAAGTEVLLNHANLPNANEQRKHRNGWVDYVLDPLNDYFSLKMASQ